MKKIIVIVLILSGIYTQSAYSRASADTSVYLLTCAPGTATYSLWGHSALRVVMPLSGTDIVYNWGVFDFSTPNFAWKFARGRLNYMLGAYPYDRFLRDYMIENRSVWSQEINLEPVEKLRLMLLITENLEPENVYYRYDFFYDDCSTRIRDLIEKILGSKLIYPPEDISKAPTFRQKIAEYTRRSPWLKLGIDFLMGTPGEKKAGFRERMFLPEDLQLNLTQAVINRDRKMVPLLQNTDTILEFSEPSVKTPFHVSPMFVFTLLFILILFLSVKYPGRIFMNYLDTALFLVFSILALMMLFFGFFTDHQQMRLNLNLIWFNPVIFICLWSVIFRKNGETWFRIVFYLALVFVPLSLVTPGIVNTSFLPLICVLILRSSVRANFSWNPLYRRDQAAG